MVWIGVLVEGGDVEKPTGQDMRRDCVEAEVSLQNIEIGPGGGE